jgi:hypothetical protein
LAINFDELFNAMEEDIQRAIVRMHWQDMFFNKLSHSLIALDPIPILECEVGIDRDTLDRAIAEAKAEAGKDNIIPVFKDFVFISTLLNSPELKVLFNLKGRLISLDLFTHHFLNGHNLNDHLYGLLSRVDIRAKAPLLAVAEPSEWALKKTERDA